MHCRDAHVINRCLRLVWPFVEKQSYFLFFVFYFIFCHETEVPVYCLGISTLLSLSFGFRPNFALENHQVSILFVLTGEMFLTNELELQVHHRSRSDICAVPQSVQEEMHDNVE